jgi:hypothetical protein
LQIVQARPVSSFAWKDKKSAVITLEGKVKRTKKRCDLNNGKRQIKGSVDSSHRLKIVNKKVHFGNLERALAICEITKGHS